EEADTIEMALRVGRLGGGPRAVCAIPTLLGLLAQILDALEVLHNHGIIHRDLKPANILVDREERVRIVDFGVAKLLDEVNSLSIAGYVSGTPEFMAPEYIMGETLSPASDMYALGCVLYTLLSGQHVFSGSPRRVMRAQCGRYPRPLSEWMELPEELSWVCLDLLHKDPMQRPTIAAVRARLGLGKGRAGERVLMPIHVRVVGRSEELREIGEAWTRAHTQAPRLMVIGGVEGMGRSALVREAAERAMNRGALALVGVCQFRESIPYRAVDPLVDALMLHINALPDTQKFLLLPHVAPVVSLFPSFHVIVDRMESGGWPFRPPPASTRDEALERMRQLLTALAKIQPLVLVIDDLHLADADSLALLQALTVDAPPEAPGWLVLATNTTTADGTLMGSASRRWFEGLGDVDRVDRLDLHPLRPVETVLLVSRFAGLALEPEEAVLLTEQTGGNPLLLTQLAPLWAKGERSQGHRSVESLVAERLEALGEEARQVVEWVSVYGGWVASDMLRAAAGLEPEVFETTVDALVHQRVLRPSRRWLTVDAQTLGYDVVLEQMRRAVYSTIRPERRQTMHRTLAHQLERQAPHFGRPASDPLWVQDWRGQTAQPGFKGRAARLMLEVADQAAQQWAY
ncbi:MAG: AAA family ATPase, partial [Myxococcota bacterium]